MFGIRFPVIGVKWSGVPPFDEDPTRFVTVDPALQSLEFATIAFDAPQAINLNETTVIELFLGLTEPLDELEKKLEDAGKEFARIRASERMEARLSGTHFAVVAVTPEERPIARTEIARWQWEVEPRNKGRHSLHLTLTALGHDNDAPAQGVIRTFDKQIEVEVTSGQPLWSLTNGRGHGAQAQLTLTYP
jgi:hypothetical protein